MTVPKFEVTRRCQPSSPAQTIDYTPKPTGKPIDYDAVHKDVQRRYPNILKRLAE